MALNCLFAVVLQVIIAAKVGMFTQDVKIQNQIEPTLSTWIFFFSRFVGSFFMCFGWWGIVIDIQTSSSVVCNMNFNESLRPFFLYSTITVLLPCIYGMHVAFYETVRAFCIEQKRADEKSSR